MSYQLELIKQPLTVPYMVVPRPLEERLEDGACVYFQVDRPFFKQKHKNKAAVMARHVLFYLLVTDAGMTALQVADRYEFNYKCVWEGVEKIKVHQTVYKDTRDALAAVRKVADELDQRRFQVNIFLEGGKE